LYAELVGGMNKKNFTFRKMESDLGTAQESVMYVPTQVWFFFFFFFFPLLHWGKNHFT